MAYYLQDNTLREIDPALVQAWIDSNNPKAASLAPIDPPPGPGYFWDGQWTAYPAPIPVVSRFQAKAALAGVGLLDTAEAMMADPATPVIARIAWQDAMEFRRDSPTLLAMGAQLGMTDAQLDQLFEVARGIEA